MIFVQFEIYTIFGVFPANFTEKALFSIVITGEFWYTVFWNAMRLKRFVHLFSISKEGFYGT